DTTVGRDTAESIRRGDMQGQSFSFTVAIDQWDWSGDVAVRTIIEVDELYDIGPVTFPAYEETSVALRAFRAARDERSRPVGPLAYRVEADHDTARLRLLGAS